MQQQAAFDDLVNYI